MAQSLPSAFEVASREDGGGGGAPTGAIVGGVVGGIGFVAIVGIIIFFKKRQWVGRMQLGRSDRAPRRGLISDPIATAPPRAEIDGSVRYELPRLPFQGRRESSPRQEA